MLKHLSFRMSITLVISAFFAILLVSSLAGAGALKLSNDALREMYERDTQSLAALQTSDAVLQRVRISLDSYQALYALGDAQPDLLAAARRGITESDRTFERFVQLQEADPQARAAANLLKAQRRAVVDKVVLPGLQALESMNIGSFKTLQGEGSESLAKVYEAGVNDRERAVVEVQGARYAQAQARFRRMIGLLAGASVAALVLGLFARAMLIRVVVRPVSETMTHLRRIASGDLSGEIRIEYRNEMGAVLADLKAMQDSLVDMVRSVRNGTETISVGAQEIASGNADLSRRTELQAASLERTVENVKQLTESVRTNAEHADNASQRALQASRTAVAGGQVVSEVVRTMQGIAVHSTKIAEIVRLIDSVAFQTNILALNAAVEAARAGDLGRGFAVVAHEVRNLAQRCADAAKEIKQLIDETVAKISEGSALADRAGETMKDVVSSFETVNGLTADISSAVQAQSVGIADINDAVTKMDITTQKNAALVEEVSAAATSLEGEASVLTDAVALFKLVPTFAVPGGMDSV
ncbi:HAMP domain-containing protein [Trinickia dinghuensis]|uniref:HAMP domain-containing protein n=2 Tax=Trinickia dinghuensis TaxID=2291023 RepID=A0A3D8K7C6_9BURK|nr:HAMP domain-containing protein [Trinickia dinghuensis]